MTLHTVIRIEDERGFGPWCRDYSLGLNGDPPNAHGDMGEAYADFLDRLGLVRNLVDRRRHAFCDMSQLRRWFGEHDRETLSREGFQLVEYTVPADRMIAGTWQVVFDATAAERGTVRPIPVGEQADVA